MIKRGVSLRIHSDIVFPNVTVGIPKSNQRLLSACLVQS
jgi:hypothetical protein